MVESKTCAPTKKKESIPTVKPSIINFDIYLKENFPMIIGEDKVDYKNVWDKHYRINYWYTKEGEAKIVRSLFVTLFIDDNDKITHKIHD